MRLQSEFTLCSNNATDVNNTALSPPLHLPNTQTLAQVESPFPHSLQVFMPSKQLINFLSYRELDVQFRIYQCNGSNRTILRVVINYKHGQYLQASSYFCKHSFTLKIKLKFKSSNKKIYDILLQFQLMDLEYNFYAYSAKYCQ